jgi:uncharacterized NAD-dependent epimerase/dehydratase family protein
MVISRIYATKRSHLEQEKNILTLARKCREKYFTIRDPYTHANILCTGLGRTISSKLGASLGDTIRTRSGRACENGREQGERTKNLG